MTYYVAIFENRNFMFTKEAVYRHFRYESIYAGIYNDLVCIWKVKYK